MKYIYLVLLVLLFASCGSETTDEDIVRKLCSTEYTDGRCNIEMVTVGNFQISKYEITVEQFGKCIEAGQCLTKNFGNNDYNNTCNFGKADRLNHPMNCVNWYGAKEYCEWIGKKLPSEEQWKSAAKANQSYKYSGSNILNDVAWWGQNSSGSTQTIGTKNPNSLGIYDMSGNVWEWTSDESLCGGSWMTVFETDLEINSVFYHYALNTLNSSYGFRCAF